MYLWSYEGSVVLIYFQVDADCVARSGLDPDHRVDLATLRYQNRANFVAATDLSFPLVRITGIEASIHETNRGSWTQRRNGLENRGYPACRE